MTSKPYSKLIVVKSLPSKLININEVLKTDIEASNRGILGLSTSGLLTIVAWIKKKVLIKHIEDVSDALWQEGGQGVIIAACHSGAMFRYTLQQDTGLTKSLQLSAKSLLSLIASKDSSISSLKSLRIWGHTSDFILLQPQSDRLVLLATNSESKPDVIGIIKTDSLQSAHLTKEQVIVQPFTGSDLYIHDAATCKTVEVLTMLVSRPGVSYIQWDYLTCSSSGTRIAITDSERRLYMANLSEKTYRGKRSGLVKSCVVMHQVIWPTSFQPSTLNNILVYLSEELLSVFCSNIINHKEVYYYLIYNFANDGGMLVLHHTFEKCTSILPGLPHGLPDLFLTEDGICMLSDKEQRGLPPHTTLESEFNQIMDSLQEALNNQDMEKIFQIKTAVEEDLSLFLSSCNQKENWVELADSRSKQHAKLVNLILTYLTKAASTNLNRTTLLGIKELAHHHIRILHDEMSNVLKYVDAEKMAQLLLQMIEQMNFYSKSVESLRLPDGKEEDQIILQKFEIWADRPIKEILEDALKTRCVKIAEQYLTLKPWIYGQIDSSLIATYCVDIARQNIATNLLVNMDHSYEEELRERLYQSKELNEIRCLEDVLNTWDVLNMKEKLAISLIKYVLKFSPHMIFKAPRVWSDLVWFRKEFADKEKNVQEIIVKSMVQWSDESLQLILIDLYARSSDSEILAEVDLANLWTYFIIRDDERHLMKWIALQLGSVDEKIFPHPDNYISENIEVSSHSVNEKDDEGVKSRNAKSAKSKYLIKRREIRTKNLMTSSIYGSDTESVYSLDSTVWEGVDGSLLATSESSFDSLANYTVTDFPESYFGFISQSMINDVAKASFSLREKLLDLLAKFGLFRSEEKGNSQIMTKRLLTNGYDLQFKPIHSEYEHRYDKKSLDMSVLKTLADNDLKSPFFDYVFARSIDLKNQNLDINFKNNWVDLIIPLQELQKTQTKENIYKLSLATLSYFVAENGTMIEDFFAVFLTMLFAPNATLSDFLKYGKAETNSNDDDPKVRDISALCQILSKQHMTPQSVIEKLAYGEYPFLQDIILERQSKNQFDISIYDLLRGTIPFDISGLFTWQRRNKYGYNQDATQPSFSDDALCKKDGVECTLDYFYYLKAGRPTFALASILLSLGEDPSKQLKEIELPVYGLALNSWPNNRICSGCVALLYLTELNYEPLRTLLYSAELITETFELAIFQNIHENLRNSQMNLVTHEIQDILNFLCSSHTRKIAAINYISLLELAIISRVTGKKIKANESFCQFRKDAEKVIASENLQSSDQIYFIFLGLKLTIDIASIYSIPMPQGIVRFLASSGEWLLFLTAIQMFQYPEKIAVTLAPLFPSESLREHMQNAFLNIKPLSTGLSEKDCSGSKISLEENEAKPFSGNKKLKKKNKSSNIKMKDDAVQLKEDLKGCQPDLIACNGDNDGVCDLNPMQIANFFDHCTDLFSIIIKCHRMVNPPFALIEASIRFKSPPLAVIATHYDPSITYSCLAVWLLVQIPDSSKVKVEISNTSIIYTDGNFKEEYPLKVKEFLSVGQQSNLLKRLFSIFFCIECIDILLKGFKIFDSSSPVLPILEGLQSTKMGKKIKDVTNILYQTTSNFLLYETAEIKWKFLWGICMFAICDGIENYLKNRYLQETFLTALIPCANEQPFATQNTDWKLLKDMITILGTTKIQIRFFKDVCPAEEVNFRDPAIAIMHDLTRADEYKAALQIAECLGLNSGDIFCSQVKSEFSQIRNDKFNLSILEAFLIDANMKITINGVSSDKACKMFESLAHDSLFPLFQYLCLQYAIFWAYDYKRQFRAKQVPFNEIKDLKVFESIPIAVEWLKYIESIEFKMWNAYIQWILVNNLEMENQYISFPGKLGNWPWEIGPDIKEVDYVYVEGACMVGQWRKFLPENESENSVNYVDKIIENLESFACHINVTKELIKQTVSTLISECWKKELVVTAVRITKHFDNNHKDANNFLSLSKIASDLELFNKRPISTTAKPERKLSKSSRGFNFTAANLTQLSLDVENPHWLSSILKLASELEYCNKTVNRILTLCRVADAIAMPFSKIIHHQDCSGLLIDVLSVECSDYIQLSKEFITAFPITVNNVNRILVDEVMKSISCHARESDSDPEKHFLSHDKIDEKWLEMISLSDDPTSVGYQLMEVVRALSKNSHPDNLAKAQVMSVELLIRAHDCFSYAAHMEGINVILQAVPDLTKSLLKHKQWILMGRLLTGIRRYQEMSYLIDLLREHQQFEVLLGKNTVKKMQSSGLDKALVHYLQCNFPDDKEMLRMVCLHFLMYAELAKMWEEDGDEIIENVIKNCVKHQSEKHTDKGPRSMFFPMLSGSHPTSPPSPSSGTTSADWTNFSNDDIANTVDVEFLKSADVNLLSEAMRCYFYASQYCVQEKQLVSGMHHSRKAELIALQISFVKSAGNTGSALRILKLTSPVLSLVLSQHLSVREIIIVSRAYDVHPDWASALYFHYIKKGFKKFLDDFLQFNDLSSDIIANVVRRMEKAGFDSQEKDRISAMLSYVEEIDFVYKIASQLNLRQKMEECLEPPLCCYLKDAVFSQGITASSNF